MIYAVVNSNGATEVREDNHSLPEGAVELNDTQYEQLSSGQYILQNGQIVVNPEPPRQP
jgi:hypothetical protein